MWLLLAVILAASLLSEGPTLLEAPMLSAALMLLEALMLSAGPMLLEVQMLLGAPLCRPRNLRPPTLADAPLDLPSPTK